MRYRGITLDRFQERAVEAIERHDTVIVAAPTGAGKTVIAEYAIERYLEQGRRIIYTAPIKALSNQKFRDFSAAWGDRIGIITGDVSINGQAPVIIMTTEIFRNTVFDDPERLHDVEYVILDEIHYINDIQRGTVWEESLIFAPQHIGFICLSATIPNLEQFAAWVREVRPGLDVAVVEEHQRPVPLEHHLWLPGHGEVRLGELRKLAQVAAGRRGRLRQHEVRRALGAGQRDRTGTGDLVSLLDAEGRLPCLYFCFSRQACEENAARYLDAGLLGPREQEPMLSLFDELRSAFGLEQDDSAARLRRLVAAGVAFHHAGMLPMLKEVVERLFASGLLRLLFTTETFAVGVNMPACTVVFESLVKYDGVSLRYLSCREYHQMAGRAGRRGIDEVGYVYSRVDLNDLDVDEIKRVTCGEVEPTESQFNLSYSSILSLYEQFGEDIYTVCHKSFANFQSLEVVRSLELELEQLGAERLPEVDCFKGVPKSIRKYLEAREELHRARGRAAGEQRPASRRGRRGGAAELRQIDRAIERLERRLADSPCEGCQQKRACTAVQRELSGHFEQSEAVRKQIRALRHHQRDQIARRLAILREFGYLDERGLTPKGQLAASLYGFEIVICELFFAGFFEQVDEAEVACLMVAVVHEGKRSAWSRSIDDQEMALYLREAAALVKQIERREWELGIENGTEALDDTLTMATLAWCDGVPLADLHAFTDASDGDIVRALRHAVDLLRQFRRAVRDYPGLQERIDRAVYLLRRDEVDAERQLRLGHRLDSARREAATTPSEG